jgi:hypothetical protein
MTPRHSIPRCDGRSRRDFLHLGVLTSFGLSLPGLLRMQAAAAGTGPAAARAKSCILIWLDGGPSHLDLFDPKPDAPTEVRGQFKAIGTAVDGIQICEHLPRTAALMNDVALIRSLTHELGNHDTGSRFLLTGHRPTPALEHPSLGSLVSRAAGTGGTMPPYVAIPHDGVGGDSNAARAGYLPGAYAAFSTGRDPSRVDGLQLPEGVGFERAARRHAMLEKIDALSRQVEQGPGTADRDAYYEQAWRLLSSPDAKAAFDLSRESRQARERYGPANIGAGCLLARRLVEAGSRFVTVVDPGWDMHQQIFRELPDSRFPGSGKLPALDRAYAALLTDLRERGLLESTLVVLMGEFGRTPKINALGGRDHWPRAGSVLMAGGGVRGGQVIGATNGFGEFPVERPVGPPDLACSILKLLGVDPGAELVTPDGRPMRVMADGSFIRELI